MKSSGFSIDSKEPRRVAVSEINGMVMFENAGSCIGSSSPISILESFVKLYRRGLTERHVINSLRISANCW